MFDQFMSLLAALNANVLWGIPMVVLMIGTGAFLLVVTRGVVFARFNVVMRYTTKTLFPPTGQIRVGAEAPSRRSRRSALPLRQPSVPATSWAWPLPVATGGPGGDLLAVVERPCGYGHQVLARSRCRWRTARATSATRSWAAPCTTSPAASVSSGSRRSSPPSGFWRSFGIGASVQANSLASERQRDVRHSSPRPSAPSWRCSPALSLIGGIRRISQITRAARALRRYLLPCLRRHRARLQRGRDSRCHRHDLPRRLHRHRPLPGAFWVLR